MEGGKRIPMLSLRGVSLKPKPKGEEVVCIPDSGVKPKGGKPKPKGWFAIQIPVLSLRGVSLSQAGRHAGTRRQAHAGRHTQAGTQAHAGRTRKGRACYSIFTITLEIVTSSFFLRGS